MKRLRKFLKIRRQDDRIKIMTIVILIGVSMFANSIYRIVKLNGQLGQRVEYILEENEKMQIKDSDITELKEIENIAAISRQTESFLSIYQGEETVTLECIGLTDEYLSEVYGIENKSSANTFISTLVNTSVHSSMKVFYLNQQAYDMLIQTEGFGEIFADGKAEGKTEGKTDGKNEADAVTIEYSMGEDEKKYKGKIVLIGNDMGQDLPCAFFKQDKASLKKNSNGVRICAAKDNLVGEMRNHFMRKGYTIANSDIVNQRNYQNEIELLHIKYSMLIAGCCVLLAYSIYVKFMKIVCC